MHTVANIGMLGGLSLPEFTYPQHDWTQTAPKTSVQVAIRPADQVGRVLPLSSSIPKRIPPAFSS